MKRRRDRQRALCSRRSCRSRVRVGACGAARIYADRCPRPWHRGGGCLCCECAGVCSEPQSKPCPLHSRRCKSGGFVQRNRILSLFAFYRIDPGRCSGKAEEGEHTSANQDLYTRALHMHPRAGVMAPGERAAPSGADYHFPAISLNCRGSSRLEAFAPP